MKMIWLQLQWNSNSTVMNTNTYLKLHQICQILVQKDFHLYVFFLHQLSKNSPYDLLYSCCISLLSNDINHQVFICILSKLKWWRLYVNSNPILCILFYLKPRQKFEESKFWLPKFSYIIRQVFLGTLDLTSAGGSKGHYHIESQMFYFPCFSLWK